MRNFAIHVSALAGTASLTLGQIAINTDNRAVAGDLRITTFASGLYYPTSMQALADGSIIVGSSVPKPDGSFYNSTGQILRFTDTNHDGIADAAPQVLADNLPGGVTSVRQAGQLLVVTSAAADTISILRMGATSADTLTTVGSIHLSFPSNMLHHSYALAVRPVSPGKSEVFFNIGSRYNATNDATTIAASGLITGDLAPESIWSFELTENTSSVSTSNLRQIASGLRNAAGMTFAANGDLYLQDNGIDGTPASESFSADELNSIAASDIGGALEDFGFSSSYTAYRTGVQVGSGDVKPIVAFQPIPSPAGSESEGANEITFAPQNWPAGLRNGIFVGFHGQFNLGGLANEENPLVWVDPAADPIDPDYFHFVSNTEAAIGHPDGLLATPDSLFISDISTGTMFSTNPLGSIYQITYVPEPTFVGFCGAMLLLLLHRRRQARQ